MPFPVAVIATDLRLPFDVLIKHLYYREARGICFRDALATGNRGQYREFTVFAHAAFMNVRNIREVPEMFIKH